MLRRIRRSPAIFLALALTAALTVGTSVGLHPEPSSALASGVDGISAVTGDAPAHGCLACLVHGAAVGWSASALPTVGPTEALLVLPDAASPAGRLAGRDLSGRSPPERS